MTPPPMEFFERPRAPLGDRRVTLSLGDLVLVLRGLDEGLARKLLERFGPFVRPGRETDRGLTVGIFAEDIEHFIEPPARTGFNRVLLACDGERVRYLGHRAAGWFDTRDGGAVLLLGRGTYEPPDHAVENFIRAAVAWQAAGRGGALVHAASAVWNERAFLFYGESGAGKSTLSASNRRARVVSDDLSLVLPAAGGGLDLVGSPFRGTYESGEPVVGRFPLAAGFRIVKADSAEVRAVPRLRALAELVGNLPFVADSLDRRPDLFAGVERAFAGLPLAHLHFRRDDSYWDAIDRAGL